MKKIVTSVIVVLSTLTACTVQNQGQSYDEVYYSPNDKSTIAEVKRPVLHKTTKEVEITADSNDLGESVIGNNNRNNGMTQDTKSALDTESYVTDNSINNNFNYDDYYDYSYASRIRRFQYGYFNDYYHDFYTNRYWYDYNPGYWGSSIYSGWGMNPGMSFYMDPFSFGYSSFGFGYNGFWNGYRGFYDGYNGFGYGYGGYGYGGYGYGGYGYGGYGYGGGYGFGGYGYGGGYTNSNDRNSSVYYGPRKDVSSSNGPTPGERTAFTQRYNAFSNGGGAVTTVNSPRNGQAVINNNISGNSGNKVATINTGRMNQLQNGSGNNLFESSNANVQRPVNNRGLLNRNDINRFISDPVRDPQVNTKKTDARSFQQQQNSYFKDRAVGNTPNKVTRENSAVRYTKPQQDVAPQQYYSPVNLRPRSGNEYTSPSYRNPGEYNSKQATPQRSVSDPQRYAPPRVYQSPVNTPSYNSNKREVSNFNTRSSSDYSAPSSPSRSTYTAPTQTYSAPSQPSYSAPSSSRESSSGSSSGSGSSGGSYNGPRR